MPRHVAVHTRPFQVFTRKDPDRIPQLHRFHSDDLLAMRAVAHVLAFRVSSYVCDELIDWDHVPDDPMFQLTFPQPGCSHRAALRHHATAPRHGLSLHHPSRGARVSCAPDRERR